MLSLSWVRFSAPTGQREAYWVAFWLLLPATLGLIVFTFAPLGYALWISFHDYQLLSGQLTWIGAGNYVRLLSDPGVLKSLLVSGLYTIISVAAQVVLGLALARYVLEFDPLVQAGADDLAAAIGPTLERYLAGKID